ncbi:MAG TPA: TOBE domain-containing protein, partial [Terriglobales bacterium]|nr:TOBE domain-containing protein [Terriglobales bacterium]
LRTRLLTDLARILRRAKQTSLYVTHDQEEAYAIADRVVLLNAGRVVQVGTSDEIYRQPASAFVAKFLGLENLFDGHVENRNRKKLLKLPFGKYPVNSRLSGNVMVLLRPDAIQLGKGKVTLPARLLRHQFRGSTIHAEFSVKGARLRLEFPNSVDLPNVGEIVSLGFDPHKALQIFPNED